MQIIVATPGRLLDLIKRGEVNLSGVHTVIPVSYTHLDVYKRQVKKTLVVNVNFVVNPSHITIAFHKSEELDCTVQALSLIHI